VRTSLDALFMEEKPVAWPSREEILEGDTHVDCNSLKPLRVMYYVVRNGWLTDVDADNCSFL
jgi:hypothetical protein